MVKREATFQIKFGHWLKEVWLTRGGNQAGAFELKATEGQSVPFDMVKPHQSTALIAAKRGKFYYKIADDSFGVKPFDCFAMSGVQAFVVVHFGDGSFCLIDIDVWENEKTASDRKSLTAGRAREIANEVIEG